MSAHVLVVDDVPKNVKLLADVLAVKGYRVSTAASGEEALAAIAADAPDLVLLDVMMPGLSGYDVCRALRADPAHAMLPIVLVTALDPAKERVNGLEAGADDFLGKPIQQPELMARVRSLLRIKHLYDEVQRQKVELADWNRTLEQRVAEGVAQIVYVTHSACEADVRAALAAIAGAAPLGRNAYKVPVFEALVHRAVLGAAGQA